MASKTENGRFIIAAGEVGAFSVCPMAWKLKWIDKAKGVSEGNSTGLGQQLHSDWSRAFDEAFELLRSVRYLLASACCAVVAFLLVRSEKIHGISKFSGSGDLIELLFILLLAIAVTLKVGGEARKRKRASGFEVKSNPVNPDGGTTLKVKDYVSETQGLAGRPDALVVEDGKTIPVERKPLAKKIRDRYIAQLLVYMRLVEEFEKKRPPYGYLIIGQNCKRVRIDNTPERQAWLQNYIDQMQAILHGKAAEPETHPRKCSRCDVQHLCEAGQGVLVKIGRTR